MKAACGSCRMREIARGADDCMVAMGARPGRVRDDQRKTANSALEKLVDLTTGTGMTFEPGLAVLAKKKNRQLGERKANGVDSKF